MRSASGAPRPASLGARLPVIGGLFLALTAISEARSTTALPLAAWQDLVRAQVERHLERMWGAPVTFRSIEFALTPPSVTLAGIECSTRLWGYSVKVRAGKLQASPALMGLMRGAVEWERIDIEGLDIRVVTNPGAGAGKRLPATEPLITRALSVQGGTLVLGGVRTRARSAFTVSGSTRPSDGALSGVLELSALTLDGLQGIDAPLRFDGKASWIWSRSALEIAPLEIHGEAGAATLSARFEEGPPELEFDSTLHTAKIPWTPPGELKLGGDWRLSGRCALKESGWEGEGSVRVAEARWGEIELERAAAGRWTLNPTGIEIRDLQLSAGGGTFGVAGEVRAPGYDRLHLSIAVQGAPASLASQLRPALPELQGVASGGIELEIPLPVPRDMGGISAGGTIRLAPAAGAAWPVSAQARFELAGEQFTASGTWKLADLRGGFTAGEGGARMTLEPTPLASLLPWIERALEVQVPEPLRGLQATVSGTGRADLGDPLSSWNLNLPLSDMVWGDLNVGDARLTAVGEPGRWSGDLSLEAAEQGPIPPAAAGGEDLQVAGVASLRWEMQPRLPETWSGELLADLSLPQAGGARTRLWGNLRAGGACRIGGALEVPRLGITAQLHAERDGGPQWVARLRASDGDAGWADLRFDLDSSAGLRAAAGQIAGWRLRSRAPGAILSWLLADTLEASVNGAAPAEGPLVRLRLLDQEPDGSVRAWGEGDLTWADGSVQLGLRRDAPSLRLNASLTPTGSWPFIVEAQAPTSQVGVAQGTRLVSVFGGGVRVEGALHPWDWRAQFDLERFALASAGREWLASGPVRGSASPDGWRMEPIRLRGEAGDLELRFDPESGDVRATGSLSVAPLGYWLGEAEAGGEIEADLSWSPDKGSRGTLKLSDLRFVSGFLPFSVDSLEGVIDLEPDGARVEGLHGTSGAGSFEIAGSVPWPGSERRWDLTLRGRGVPVRQPAGLSGVADLSLRLEGGAAQPRVSGETRLTQGVYNLPAELARGGGAFLSLGFGDAVPPALRPLELQASVRVESLWVRSDYTRIQSQGNLLLSGSLSRPDVRGQMVAAEGGEVRFSDVRYRVASGVMRFTGGPRIDPRIDLTAETERGDYSVQLEVTGTLSRLRVGLRSDPPLPTAEIVRLLTTGRVEGEGTGPPGGLAGGLVGSVVGGRVLAPLESGLQAFLPIDTLDIDPLAVSSQGDPTARVTLGKRISRRVTLSYSSNLENNQEDLYQLRYRLNPGTDLTASREDDGSIGGDVRASRRLYPPGTRPARDLDEARRTLRHIRFHGDSPFSRRRLRASLMLTPGEPVSTFELFDSRERLWRLHARAGYPEAVVEASLRPRRRRSADAVFSLRTGRRLEIRLEGADLSRDLEEQILDLWIDPELRSLVAPRAEQRIAEYFRHSGHPGALARFQGTREEGDREVWTFEVQQGKRVEIRALHFTGTTSLDPRELLAAVQTRADSRGDRGTLVESRLVADTRAIEALYAESGFREARVDLQVPVLDAGGQQAEVTWTILEGPRHRIAETRVVPSEAAQILGDPLERLQMVPGAFLSDRALEEDADLLRSRLDRRGYPRAGITSRVEGEPGALLIIHELNPGPPLRVGEVTVQGNLLTRSEVIRRELGFGNGDPLSERQLDDAQRRLYELGVFRAVSVEADLPPAGGPRVAGAEAEPTPAGPVLQVPVRVDLLESPPLTLGAGVGYDSDDRFRGRLDISNRNLFGSRLYAGGVARAGATERRVQALLRDPALFKTRLAGLVAAFYEEEEKETFDIISRGTRLQLEQKPTPRLTLFYRYALSDENLSNVSVTGEEVEPEVRLGHLGWSLAYDSRNDFADPARGLFGSLDFRWFGHELASEAEFGRAFLQISHYRSPGARIVWASGLRLGLLRPLGGEEQVPISERFFAGGDSSVRGFERDTLGPVDPVSDDPLGGELLLILNQELRFPIWRFLRGVTFYDGGNVFAEPAEFEARGLRHVLGVGARIETPLGPVRLDYGWRLDRQPEEDRGRLHFSIGHAF